IGCRFLTPYSDIAQKCDTIGTNYNTLCDDLRTKFGSIDNPFSVGNHGIEILTSTGSVTDLTIFSKSATFTVIKELKCGDSICSPENSENPTTCSLDCKGATCSDGLQNSDERGVDCGGNLCNPCDSSGDPCVSDFKYGTWSECTDTNIQTRNYQDLQHCGVVPDEPIQRTCITECTPDYQYSDWKECKDRKQTRTFTDKNCNSLVADKELSRDCGTNQTCTSTQLTAFGSNDCITPLTDNNLKNIFIIIGIIILGISLIFFMIWRARKR
ncbi:MAG: hypothetical protein AABY22_10980, partial [Nanoarchaeota archaeon]